MTSAPGDELLLLLCNLVLAFVSCWLISSSNGFLTSLARTFVPWLLTCVPLLLNVLPQVRSLELRMPSMAEPKPCLWLDGLRLLRAAGG